MEIIRLLTSKGCSEDSVRYGMKSAYNSIWCTVNTREALLLLLYSKRLQVRDQRLTRRMLRQGGWKSGPGPRAPFFTTRLGLTGRPHPSSGPFTIAGGVEEVQSAVPRELCRRVDGIWCMYEWVWGKYLGS